MGKPIPKYTEEFKRSLVSLYRNGKSQSQLCAEFGVSHSALAKWVKRFSEDIEDNNSPMTAKQLHDLQKRIARLEEENLILKKALAIFTPHSLNALRLFII